MLLALMMEEGAMSQGMWQPLEAENGLQYTAGKEWGPQPHHCKEISSCPVPRAMPDTCQPTT